MLACVGRSYYLTLDVEKAKNDVQPFIKDIREIELWSKEFFIAVIENIKVK